LVMLIIRIKISPRPSPDAHPASLHSFPAPGPLPHATTAGFPRNFLGCTSRKKNY
jgi:hypothetical protein